MWLSCASHWPTSPEVCCKKVVMWHFCVFSVICHLLRYALVVAMLRKLFLCALPYCSHCNWIKLYKCSTVQTPFQRTVALVKKCTQSCRFIRKTSKSNCSVIFSHKQYTNSAPKDTQQRKSLSRKNMSIETATHLFHLWDPQVFRNMCSTCQLTCSINLAIILQFQDLKKHSQHRQLFSLAQADLV